MSTVKKKNNGKIILKSGKVSCGCCNLPPCWPCKTIFEIFNVTSLSYSGTITAHNSSFNVNGILIKLTDCFLIDNNTEISEQHPGYGSLGVLNENGVCKITFFWNGFLPFFFLCAAPVTGELVISQNQIILPITLQVSGKTACSNYPELNSQISGEFILS